ncbi:MAG: orotidine-5'-phosphate decarboxylase [Candidatus Omnitrophica bacterium]|nr:orotidine-5'-phosphate decarboxylase [Candidatus Omnitrophota bacterium]
MKRTNQIIIALDTSDIRFAKKIVHLLKDSVRMFKVGSELFTAHGPKAVRMVRDAGAEVFLDLKYHDIPNTVARAAQQAVRLGVFMFNVHAAGGLQMMQEACMAAAEEARKLKIDPPKLIAVTVLTSLNQEEVTQQVGISKSLKDAVLHYAELAQKAGLDGVVASAMEVEKIRSKLGSKFLIVTPGIRPSWAERGDQERVMTPQEALKLGANYLVIGRPITEAEDPKEAVRSILNLNGDSPHGGQV